MNESRGQTLARNAGNRRADNISAAWLIYYNKPDEPPPDDDLPISFYTADGEFSLTFGEFRAACKQISK